MMHYILTLNFVTADLACRLFDAMSDDDKRALGFGTDSPHTSPLPLVIVPDSFFDEAPMINGNLANARTLVVFSKHNEWLRRN
jgi:hypothetical protein